MSFATISTVGNRQRRGRRPKRGGRGPRPYGVSGFVIAYLVSLAALLLALVVTGPLAILAYFVIGVTLIRFIGNRVKWWRMTNSVENIAAVKLRAILTWPVSVPKFIVTLAIAKWF